MTFTILWVLCCTAVAHADSGIIVSLSAQAGIMPRMGGDMPTLLQAVYLDNPNGISGINRSKTGYATSNISHLTGFSGGLELRMIFLEYLLVKTGGNFGMSAFGGTGTTLDTLYNPVAATYSLLVTDIPVGAGLSLPLWRDGRISFTAGMAFAYGRARAAFTSVLVSNNAVFSGWGFPLFISVCGEYFINNTLALSSTVSYYRGSTPVQQSGLDFGEVDFTGYRWNLGLSLYFNNR